MNLSAELGVEETPPNPDIVDSPPGYEQGFERILFENVLWIKHQYNKDEPVFYAPLAHPRVFIPQDKLNELGKYFYVVPEEVHFQIEDIEGVNDFKVGATSQMPIYIQDIKIEVLDTTGDMTHPCQFFPFPAVSQLDNWMNIQRNSEKGEYTSLPNVELVQNQYVQKCDTAWSTIEIPVSRRDIRWKTINIKPGIPNITQSWKNQIGFLMQPYHFFKRYWG